MNTIKKLMLLFAVAFICTLFYASPAEAKALANNKAYRVDLNGDGKKESVKCKIIEDNSNVYKLTANIYINGKKKKTVKCSYALEYSSSCSIIDIKKKDKKKEIYIHFQSDSSCFEKGIAYRYDGKSLKECFSLSPKKASSARLEIKQNQPGDGFVHYEVEYGTLAFMQGYVDQKFRIKSKKLLPTSTKLLKTISNTRKQRYRPIHAMTVYKDSNCKKSKFTLNWHEEFSIEKIYFNNPKNLMEYEASNVKSIYIKTASGKKGWIKIPSYKFVEGYEEYSGQWSEWAYTWS